MRALKQFMTKIPLLIRAVSLYVIAGAILYGGSTVVAAYTPESQPVAQIATAPKIKTLSRQIVSGHPVTFSVEKLDIKLPVKDGTYNTQTNQWTLTDDAVFFAVMTSEPNDTQGNTFIYGHNQPQVIEPMKDITVGDIVTIKTSNGHSFHYEYVRDTIIAPTFTKVLNENPKKPQLTVMTCEGIWSETRRLMYFDFVEVV